MQYNQPKYRVLQTVNFRQEFNEDMIFEGKCIILSFGYWHISETEYEVEYIVNVDGKRYSILESEMSYYMAIGG